MSWLPSSSTEWLGAAALLGYLAYLALRARASFAYLREEREALPKAPRSYALTVLQPIEPGTADLRASLEATLEHRDPKAEFVWLIDEKDDESSSIAAELDRPGVTIVRCPAPAPGATPWVEKLVRGMERVKGDHVAVLHGGTTVGAAHTKRAVAALGSDRGRGGLYVGLPAARPSGDSRGADLLAASIHSTAALTYLPAMGAGQPIPHDSAFAVARTEDWAAAGGFAALRGGCGRRSSVMSLFLDAGLGIHQGGMAQCSWTGPLSLGQAIEQWNGGHQPIGAALGLGAPALLLWAGLLVALTSKPLAILLGAVLVVRLWTLSALVEATLEPDLPRDGPVVFPISSTLSELLQPFLTLRAVMQSRL